MKILKKIGLVCLTLMICFCSCFKFINAQNSNSFTYNASDTYYFMIVSPDVFEEQAPVRVASGIETDMSFNISYPLDNPTVDIIDPSGSNVTNVVATYIGDFNGNKCYSFVPDVYSVANGTTMEYFETNSVVFSLVPFSDDNSNNGFSVYDTIYDLVETYIFGGNITVGSHQDLTATILSSIICVLVFALPFLIIWKVIKVIMG